MKQSVTYHRPLLGTVAPPHPAQALVHAALAAEREAS